MEDDGFNVHNWGLYYQPSYKTRLNLQLKSNNVSSSSDHHNRDAVTRSPYVPPDHHHLYHNNTMFGTTNGAFQHQTAADNFLFPMAPLRNHHHMDSWANQRERLLNTLPANLTNYTDQTDNAVHNLMPPTMLKWEDFSKDQTAWSRVDEPQSSSVHESDIKSASASFGDPTVMLKTNKRKKKASAPNSNNNNVCRPSVKRGKRSTKSVDMVINGMDLDITDIPIPICTCTGMPQQCYKWGYGGWQSACCTTSMSMHPLPMSTKRRGARISGRKMSQGAFKKVLEKLSDEGYCFSNPIDLRTHWAKHGTNKFVTIK